MADGAASQEDVLKGIIGQPTGKSRVVVERGPVQHFADAVLSTSPIYHDPDAAKAAGFDAIPAPADLALRHGVLGQVRGAPAGGRADGQPARRRPSGR